MWLRGTLTGYIIYNLVVVEGDMSCIQESLKCMVNLPILHSRNTSRENRVSRLLSVLHSLDVAEIIESIVNNIYRLSVLHSLDLAEGIESIVNM